MPQIFLEISKNEMIFKTPLETKQETIPIEIIIKLIFFKIKNERLAGKGEAFFLLKNGKPIYP